ncbi:MAG: ABC transporter permease [Acidimicrobiia bacterium]|nr:ABC transporter permease [Acidimicrobiia bacterium]
MVQLARPSTQDAPELRLMAARRSVVEHVREISRFRELVGMLVRKELTVRYQHSTLGFVWSMIQPLFLLIVYSVVFAILRAGFADFAIWVLCGLLVWTLVSTSLTTATQSITSNASLVGKVKFPRAVLPLSSVGAALVHFCLQAVAFAVILAVTRHDVAWSYMWLVPVALLTCAIVCAAMALLLAPLNVYARDTTHLLELLVLGWFWATPILYQYERAASWFGRQGFGEWILLVNPVTPIVITVQRAIYGTDTVDDLRLLPASGPAWYLGVLLATAAAWGVVLALSLRAFDRADIHLAETL